MASDPLTILTLLTNFLCMAISLWFAIYLMARSHANQITFRAVVSLLALAFYYNNAFTELVNPSVETATLRTLAIIIALVAAHDLTYYLLPGRLRNKLYWVARGILLLGIVIVVLLFYIPQVDDCDPRFHCPGNIISPWVIIATFEVLVFSAIVYNLWQIKQSGGRLQSRAFYLAVLLAVGPIAISTVGVILNLDLPRFINNLLVLGALSLMIYSVVRYQTFVSRQIATYDLPITMLTITIITGIYILTGWQIGLSAMGILLLAVLAIFTHSAYDFVRELLARLFRSQERLVRRQLRDLERETVKEPSLHRYLRRGLAILCYTLDASSGFIAVRKESQYEVVASLHSLPVGTQFPPREVTLEEISQPTSVLMKQTAWLVPAFAGGEQVAVVGIGARKDRLTYGEGDLSWLEDIADELGDMVYAHSMRRDLILQQAGNDIARESTSRAQKQRADELLAALTLKTDPELVMCVEEGFRNLHDYSALGRSPLVQMFDIQAVDHIERGKLVQGNLIHILEKLRPYGEPPAEPLPREWYSYTILHDAYVEERPARDIMSKLYISEGTYYRTRRKALRGVTRALMETGAAA